MSEDSEVNGVKANNKDIQRAIRDAAKKGTTKDEAIRRIGVPYEIVDREYQKARKK